MLETKAGMHHLAITTMMTTEHYLGITLELPGITYERQGTT